MKVQTVMPLNLTGRTKAEIVLDAEMSWLKPYLIATDEALAKTRELFDARHTGDCHCEPCIQIKLDETLKRLGLS